MFNFKDKVAIVTGGSRGIGLGIVKKLAAMGCNVAIVSTRVEKSVEVAEQVASEFSVECKGYGCDVSNFENVTETFKSIVADFDRVDILVNNAGITKDGLLMRMKEDDWDSVIDVNLKSVFNATKAIIRQMLKQKYGRIINMSSINGLVGQPGQANYAASKAGIIGITKSTSKEFATKGITINAIAPGFIQTDMTDELTEDQINSVLAIIPSRELGQVDDIANAVCYLASEEARYVNGHVLSVDGGMNA